MSKGIAIQMVACANPRCDYGSHGAARVRVGGKSPYCSFCRDRYPHQYQKPSKATRDARYHLAAVNCHCEHEHSECDVRQAVGGGACGMCYGFSVAADVWSCEWCRESADAFIHPAEERN